MPAAPGRQVRACRGPGLPGPRSRCTDHRSSGGSRVLALVWQFEVKPGRNAEFEAFYGADGAWTTLSRRSRSFLGSSFLRDLAAASRYLVVEYWSEMVVY